MKSRINGFEPDAELKWRMWDGVVADVWSVRATEGASGEYISPDPRLFVVLELSAGGQLTLADELGRQIAVFDRPGAIFYVPADSLVRVSTQGVTRLKHLDLHLMATALKRRFGNDLHEASLRSVRHLSDDRRILRIAEAIAEECESESGLHDRYGSGLLDALLAATFDVKGQSMRARRGLTRAQMETVTSYLDANCFETVRLSDLAQLVGLSESYFSHAFKSTTGLPPSRWQMQSRIRRIQGMIVRDSLSLTDAATLAGFADQAHFTRAFKSVIGLTPAEWRRTASDSDT